MENYVKILITTRYLSCPKYCKFGDKKIPLALGQVMKRKIF